MSLKWDKYSDQPAMIKDKALKKRIYKDVRWDSFKMILTNVLVYPIAYIYYLLSSVKKIDLDTHDFFGMSINLDKNPEETKALIDDLDVDNLLIRMPLHDIENIERYVAFTEQFKGKSILINILQDRRHVEDLPLLKNSLNSIFDKFSHLTNRFQIGNAINRKKWAIFSMDEYFGFYRVAYDLKQESYPNLVLIGPSIIDFEYYFTVRTLFNQKKVQFDQCSSLLYVDRRGAPENTQMGLNLQNKLLLLQALLRLSPKIKQPEIVITEVNWPITNTAPYAPTSENDCVNLDDHASFLVRYYLLALATGVVKNVYWHQLIAPGYGLVDNRNNELITHPAYQAFKVMLAQLQGATLIQLKEQQGLYRVLFKGKKGEVGEQREVEVLWALQATPLIGEELINKTLLSRDGAIQNLGHSEEDTITIGASPVYLISASKGTGEIRARRG